MTTLSAKAEPYVRPLAERLHSDIVMTVAGAIATSLGAETDFMALAGGVAVLTVAFRCLRRGPCSSRPDP